MVIHSDIESLKSLLSLVEWNKEEIFLLTFDSVKDKAEKRDFLKLENVSGEALRNRVSELHKTGILSEDGKFSAHEWVKGPGSL